MPSAVALIPARSGSERVRDKNVRPLAGHPLLAYAVAAARDAGVFDRIVCSTDSGKIGYLRPSGTCTLADHGVSFAGKVEPPARYDDRASGLVRLLLHLRLARVRPASVDRRRRMTPRVAGGRNGVWLLGSGCLMGN